MCDIRGCETNTMGTCVERPVTCPDVFIPVCGCNCVTYDNDCERILAEVAQATVRSCSFAEPPVCSTDGVAVTHWLSPADGNCRICAALCTGCTATCRSMSEPTGWYANCGGGPGSNGGCPGSGVDNLILEWACLN